MVLKGVDCDPSCDPHNDPTQKLKILWFKREWIVIPLAIPITIPPVLKLKILWFKKEWIVILLAIPITIRLKN